MEYPVKSIGGNAFFGNPWITRIYFEEGIELIMSGVCAHCPKLESAAFPSSLRTFYGSWEGVPRMTTLVLPEGVESLASGFLYGLTGLQGTVTIPSTVNNIFVYGNGPSSYMFEGYVVHPANQYFKADNGVLLSRDGTVLYSVPTTSTGWVTEYTTPSTVTKIINGCFYSIPRLTTLTFSEGVTNATNAITVCHNLVTLNLPASLQSTPFTSYAVGYKLTAVNVAAGSQYLSSEDGILYNANKTEVLFVPAGRHYDTLTFPSTVTTVGICAMISINVNRFTFGPNVQTLRTRSIVGCGRYTESLTDAGKTCIIPASLTTVDTAGILYDCYFDEYLVEEGNPQFTIQNNMLLSKDGSRLYAILLKRGMTIDTVVVPSTVTRCNAQLLGGKQTVVKTVDFSQTKITELSSYVAGGALDGFQVKFPNTLTRITGGATIFSSTLKRLEIPASVTSIAQASFYVAELEELIFLNPNEFVCNNIFGLISTKCVIRGYRGSSAEQIARQYTLRFEPLD